MANKTRMVIVLKDGEELRGTIEWYDRNALKVHRTDAPNILLLKDNVKYMYKENESMGSEDEE
jgi:small nuclear ribonucleoprotein (snRNP)-like protein